MGVVNQAQPSLRQQARERFPQWSRAQQARWVLAKRRAAKLDPKWARMIPLTADQIPPPNTQFTPRTLRELM